MIETTLQAFYIFPGSRPEPGIPGIWDVGRVKRRVVGKNQDIGNQQWQVEQVRGKLAANSAGERPYFAGNKKVGKHRGTQTEQFGCHSNCLDGFGDHSNQIPDTDIQNNDSDIQNNDANFDFWWLFWDIFLDDI